MERYFYFGEATVATTGEACLFPLSSFLGMTPAALFQTTMHFKSRNGAATDDTVLITHTGTKNKPFMVDIVRFLRRNQRNPYMLIAEGTNLDYSKEGAIITAVAVTTDA
jgi:hypothetical protein